MNVAANAASRQGTQFSAAYAIVRPLEPPTSYIFFKMMLNGRHITSWGVRSAHGVSGSVSHALYQPVERHHPEDHLLFRAEGIESRSFHFAPNHPSGSVAEDGGLIEIKVFRARSRSRRAPRLEQYRDQHRYGIM